MGLLSCLAIGLLFLVAVGLLVFVGVLLGWCLPAAVERARRRGPTPPEGGSGAAEDSDVPRPSTPAETDSRRGT
ncbi:MAG TPA: hypothetical protein VKE50_00015 [Thermoanaerobaculia bacterium]|nr:hypothetical protein [Thermoanaerobaculia bacterium]